MSSRRAFGSFKEREQLHLILFQEEHSEDIVQRDYRVTRGADEKLLCALRMAVSVRGEGQDRRQISEVRWADWSEELRREDDVWVTPRLKAWVPR